MIERGEYAVFPGTQDAAWRILELLASCEGSYVSGETLSRSLGISRTAVWKHVLALTRAGFSIEATNKLGYRLTSGADPILPTRIQDMLNTGYLGRQIYLALETGSTNEDARRAAEDQENPVSPGAVFVALHQTRGKGRLGRSWLSTRGSIAMSALLKPAMPPAMVPGMSLAAGLAVARAMCDLGIRVQVKWPNDILLAGKKLCGILCEMRANLDCLEYMVIGIGLNVNSTLEDLDTSISTSATSLFIETGRQFQRNRVIARILDRLEETSEAYAQFGLPGIKRDLLEYMAYLGQEVTVSNVSFGSQGSIIGVFEDIGPSGELLLRKTSGELALFPAGDVSLKKAPN